MISDMNTQGKQENISSSRRYAVWVSHLFRKLALVVPVGSGCARWLWLCLLVLVVPVGFSCARWFQLCRWLVGVRA